MTIEKKIEETEKELHSFINNKEWQNLGCFENNAMKLYAANVIFYLKYVQKLQPDEAQLEERRINNLLAKLKERNSEQFDIYVELPVVAVKKLGVIQDLKLAERILEQFNKDYAEKQTPLSPAKRVNSDPMNYNSSDVNETNEKQHSADKLNGSVLANKNDPLTGTSKIDVEAAKQSLQTIAQTLTTATSPYPFLAYGTNDKKAVLKKFSDQFPQEKLSDEDKIYDYLKKLTALALLVRGTAFFQKANGHTRSGEALLNLLNQPNHRQLRDIIQEKIAIDSLTSLQYDHLACFAEGNVFDFKYEQPLRQRFSANSYKKNVYAMFS